MNFKSILILIEMQVIYQFIKKKSEAEAPLFAILRKS